MDINSKQRQNRPILKPSRSSHGRMQFVGFGLAPPPKRKNKNIPQAERSKILNDAEELIRIMGNTSDQALSRETVNKVAEQHTSITSDKYRFMLEKPWRTGQTAHVVNVSSHSQENEHSKEITNNAPKTFVVSDPFPQKNPLRDSQPKKVQRKGSREVEELYTGLAPSNESLGRIGDGSSHLIPNDDQQQISPELVTKLKDKIEQLKRDHEAELKKSTDEHAKSLLSAREALEQAQLSARVKLSSLERKLADANLAEAKRKEEEARKNSMLDTIENELAAVELDRRMEVSSLQRKLVSVEGRVQDLLEKMSMMMSEEDCEQRIVARLVECEKEHQISESRLVENMAKQKKEYDHMANNLADLQKENCAIRKENDVFKKQIAACMENAKDAQILQLQNVEMAAKIAKLEEDSIYSEAKYMETLQLIRAENESLARELEKLQEDRLELLKNIDELSTNQCSNILMTEEKPLEANEKTQKIGELWERLDDQHSMIARLHQENRSLTDQLQKTQASVVANKELEQNIKSLETKLASTTAELVLAKSSIAEKELHNKNLCQELEQLQTKATEDIKSLRSDCVQREILMSDMESNVKVLEKLLAEAKRNLDLVEERSGLCDRLKNQLESREEEWRELEATHHRMRQDLQDALDREIGLREEHKQTTEAHRNQVDEFEAELSHSKTRICELQQQLSNLIPLSQEVGRVKMALHDVTENLRRSELCNQTLNDQIAKLEHQLTSSNAKILQIEAQLEDANQRKEETTARLSNLESAQAKEQEILSEELRESETTIACLMEELELLKSVVPELESTELALERSNKQYLSLETAMKTMQAQKEEELSTLQGRLEASSQEIKELRLQLLPMTKELQQASRELEEMHQQLKGFDYESNMEKFRLFEEEITALRRELEDSTTALELSEKQLASVRQETDELKCHLTRSTETIIQFQAEVNMLKPKVQLYERKLQECESLNADLEAKDKQINLCRLQLQDMEEERNYSRARIAELDDLFHHNGSTLSVLEHKAHEVAQLKAERDTLKQKLNVVVAMVTALEEDNKQKKQLVHEMMSRSGDAGGFSTEALVESLQKDLERTLKRCADLSLQLADSHFQMDQLTEQVRRNKKSSANDASSKRVFRRSGSYDSPSRSGTRRSTITSMLANSFNAMDESLRGVAGMGTNDKLQSPIMDAKFINPS